MSKPTESHTGQIAVTMIVLVTVAYLAAVFGSMSVNVRVHTIRRTLLDRAASAVLKSLYDPLPRPVAGGLFRAWRHIDPEGSRLLDEPID